MQAVQAREEQRMASEELYPPRVVKTMQALLTRPASTPSSLRQAVLARAAKLAEKAPSPEAVPADLTAYLDQVVVDAERTTDADVQGLKDHGYSEDQIFELTLCAAFGAGLARLERGLQALEGRE
jgi:alkylhydroperoxidase family enzyme